MVYEVQEFQTRLPDATPFLRETQTCCTPCWTHGDVGKAAAGAGRGLQSGVESLGTGMHIGLPAAINYFIGALLAWYVRLPCPHLSPWFLVDDLICKIGASSVHSRYRAMQHLA